MVRINMIDVIVEGVKELGPFWKNSKHEAWFRNSVQAKGKLGTIAYERHLQSQGIKTRRISDEGDLEYCLNGKWLKTEVKAAAASLKELRDGFVNESCWFNQIRPNQTGWDEIVLVGFYPNHLRIWKMNREEFSSRSKSMTSITAGHVGTKDLIQVRLRKNSRQNNFPEWNCIYNDQQEGLL